MNSSTAANGEVGIESLTEQLARFAASLTLERVPGAVKHEARRFALDTLACVIAGAHSQLAPPILQATTFFGAGCEATLAGHGRKRSSAIAASYGNGRLANCLDFDETYPGGQVAGLHFGGSIFAEALASCEQAELATGDLLLAIICGYEVAGRIADIGTQMDLQDGRVIGVPEVYGFELEATVGAAAAAGRLLNHSPAEMEHAFGVAATSAATPHGPVWARHVVAPNSRYFDSGWAAMTGGFAARAVRGGVTSLPAIFDGKPSIFTMVGSRHVDPDGLVGELGSRWALENLTYKPWPCCRAMHRMLWALGKARATFPFELCDIEEIVVGAHLPGLSRRWLNDSPGDGVARQFSIPHAIALFLLGVPPGPEWVSERWGADPVAAALRGKVRYEEYAPAARHAAHFVRGGYRQIPCFVEVKTADRTARGKVEFTWGDPWTVDTRFTDDDIVAKFRTATGLPAALADPVIDTLLTGKAGGHLSPILDALAWNSP
ncbi:2-methylcitrate dehydratase PrpD [Bradyrhizobium elkanii]|nr:2-methylcitrate dehydratase PrpD [Bradyrhizobium elkanii]